MAERNHPHAAFTLNEISAIASVLFRAFGGNGSLRVAAAGTTRNSASRRWLDRISGNAERIANAALDDETLRLPDSIALFADRQLNRDLYFWLIALAGTMSGSHPFLQQPTTSSSTLGTSWLAINQSATCNALKRYPGLRRRYDRLIDTHIASRIAADKLSADEARAELAVRQALRHPGTVDELPTARRPPEPVPLWLFPSTHSIAHATVQTEESKSIRTPGAKNGHRLQRRQQGERITEGNGRSGILLPFRAESLMTWAEYRACIARTTMTRQAPHARQRSWRRFPSLVHQTARHLESDLIWIFRVRCKTTCHLGLVCCFRMGLAQGTTSRKLRTRATHASTPNACLRIAAGTPQICAEAAPPILHLATTPAPIPRTL
ncbi:MAG: hypothetical protein U1F34_01440 [Gammaproteobacteria bacterium]